MLICKKKLEYISYAHGVLIIIFTEIWLVKKQLNILWTKEISVSNQNSTKFVHQHCMTPFPHMCPSLRNNKLRKINKQPRLHVTVSCSLTRAQSNLKFQYLLGILISYFVYILVYKINQGVRVLLAAQRNCRSKTDKEIDGRMRNRRQVTNRWAEQTVGKKENK